MYNPDWVKAEKKVDAEYKGSLFETLELSEFLCPTCGAHLKMTDGKTLICLNACHLDLRSRENFAKLFQR